MSPNKKFEWTDDSKKHNNPISPTTPNYLWRFLPAVVLHELAHMLGLDELYDRSKSYPGSVMDDTTTQTAKSSIDLQYLQQIYREYED